MDKKEAEKYIIRHKADDDDLIGIFQAQSPFPIWWFLLLGPFGLLFFKTYFIAVTKNGINFYRLSLLGKFNGYGDFFNYTEIESIKIKKGMMQRPLIFKLKNGVNVKIKAQLKGLDRVAKLNDETQNYIKQKITVVE